ncbi:undecaprenyldiphospho-muramoylpentapeptide beta-N-acetylglucosaminyltransferase [Microbacterium sp. YY-01]|uniref:undecaprenyldiphospho-muramoylpentapeptide beta-N-acetylglucosaminyltransferase n=1 Tax=Microbacterium sp. YY-01 TaxID=3421634 RepID=UPI003D16608E
MTTYLLAGGGTAGHVNPLLAVADGLRSRDPEAEVLVLGTREGLEARLVPQRGYELLFIPRLPFPRRPNRAAVAFPARYRKAVQSVRDILRERRVDAVVGFGGYASAPAYTAAKKEKIPFIVHEANARPGLANVLGARRAAAVGVAFPDTPLKGAQLVGMPLRHEIVDGNRATLREEALAEFGLSSDKPVLLVFGGSLGARQINTAVRGAWRDILDIGWQVLHVCGERDEITDPGHDGYVIRPYIDRMDRAFAVADMALCRSGAATVSELSALGIPAIYVPYAVGNGEQRLNAASAVAAGAAILEDDSSFTAERIRQSVIPLLADSAARERMASAAQRVGSRRGTENLIALVDDALAGASGE